MIRRIAYSAIPESGGLFRFYKNLRKSLLNYDWDVRAVSIGPAAAARWDQSFADNGCHLIAPDVRKKIDAARALTDWLEQNRIDILMPMDDSIAASCVPHLPASIRLVTRCSSSTAFAYRISAIYPERLARAVVMTPRQQKRLLEQDIPEKQVALIPHGVDTESFIPLQEEFRVNTDTFKLTYVGRLDHQTKGVLLLPLIAERLKEADIPFELDVFGDGSDRRRMEKLIEKSCIAHCVRLHGTVSVTELSQRLSEFDCLLMPSYVEGFPNILVEAMSSGVVPIVSHLPGVTDFIVDHGNNGFLCTVDNATSFSEAVLSLHSDRSQLTEMARAARKVVEDRFSLSTMGANYDQLFNAILSSSYPKISPLPWSAFKIHPAFRGSILSRLPRPVVEIIKRLFSHRSALK